MNTFCPWGHKKERIVKESYRWLKLSPTLSLSLLKMPREHGMTERAEKREEKGRQRVGYGERTTEGEKRLRQRDIW